MAFDSLSEKLQNVFRNLRSKGRLTEDDVKTALKEVKLALLEADVNFKVVKNFTKEVQAQAIGSDVMNGLNPGQMVIKIVHDEMVKMMGSEKTELVLKPGSELTVIMMAALPSSSHRHANVRPYPESAHYNHVWKHVLPRLSRYSQDCFCLPWKTPRRPASRR